MNAEYKEALEKLRLKQSYGQYLICEDRLKYNADLPKLKIAVLRNYTAEMLEPVLVGEAALMGYAVEVYFGGYDNIFQEVLNQEGALYQFDPDIILLSLWLPSLSSRLTDEFSFFSDAEIEEEKRRILAEIKANIETIKKYSDAVVLINNFTIPSTAAMGIFDTQSRNSQTGTIIGLNLDICDFVSSKQNVYITDLFSLVYKNGYYDSFDPKMWAISKNPFSKTLMVDLAKEWFKFIKALKGKTKKCIILDCDNTLWGGIVGEAGTFGIKLNDDYPGRCYKDFQRELLNLYNRGVLIALCSKNNQEDVTDVLKNNSEMLIKEEHIAAMQINWDNKAENIVRISKQLNIGTDSLVFIDDSPFECNLIMESLPEVDVIRLNEEPSQYAQILRDCGLFNSLSVTEDDRIKTQMYRADIARSELKNTFDSIDDYLRSLHMTAHIGVNDYSLASRVAQLTQKTNQFNLTTKRYTEEDILKFISDENYDVITIRLEDKLAPLGIVGAAIILYHDEMAEIDTFLLSCRAIGRTVENTMMQIMADRATRRKCLLIRGKYIPTSKNILVKELYDSFGLKKVNESDGVCLWENEIEKIEINKQDIITIIE